MKGSLALAIPVLALLIFPIAAFGAEGFLGQIVPDSVLQCAPYCEACNLVDLFDSVLRFAVYFSVFVATLMFAYAGFLYVTASSNKNNITEAHKIFGTVFLGLVWVLGAWLVVNLLINVFIGPKLPWNSVPCKGYTDSPIRADPAQSGPPPIDADLPGDPARATCPTCDSITSLQCKNPMSCSGNASFRLKVDEFAEALGDRAGETIITESGPVTTLDHVRDDIYASGDTADISCRGASRTASGGCTGDWVKRNIEEWEKAGGSRAVYETDSQSDADAAIVAGVPSSKVKVLPNCSTGKSPCVSGPHLSIYN